MVRFLPLTTASAFRLEVITVFDPKRTFQSSYLNMLAVVPSAVGRLPTGSSRQPSFSHFVKRDGLKIVEDVPAGFGKS